MKRYILTIFCVLAVIYFLSSMPYEKQSIIPELHVLLANQPFKELLSNIEITYWGRTISIEESGYFHFIEFLFRKGAHFFGYGIVGVILYLFYRKMRWQLPSLLAIGSVFVIGGLDELRQRFTPGRTGIFQDVLLDTSGAITCILLTKFVLWLFAPRRV